MERKLEIGGHVVFIDECRKEHNALVTAIHGDPLGGLQVAHRRSVKEGPAPEWEHSWTDPNNIYVYETDANGDVIYDAQDRGQHWPCINVL